MTTVNVTKTENTVSVTTEGKTTVVNSPVTTTVTATTVGPQGAVGLDLIDTAKVDGSLIYYNSVAGSYKADATWTISTIVVGGSF